MNRECGRWLVEKVAGTPLEIHALDPPLGVVPTIWVIEPAASALVLGSTQSRQMAWMVKRRNLPT